MKKLFNDWKWFLLGLLGILGLGFLIRIYNLTLLPVFADEAIYVRWSQIMANESTLRFLPLSDGKQPLFMWILMFIIEKFSDPLFAGRVISVLAGLGTIAGVFTLSYLLFRNKKAAFISSFLVCLSPFFVFFDRMALVDSLLTALLVWMIFFGVWAAKTRRLDLSMITGFFLGLSMLTKSSALFFVILLPFIFVFLNKKKDFFKVLPLSLVAILISAGMYNILRLGPNFHLLKLRTLDYVYPYSHILTSPLDPFKGHLGGIINYFYLLGPLAIVALVILGALNDFKKNHKSIILLLVLGIAPVFVVAEYSKVVTARYVVYAIPFFTVLAGNILYKKSLFKYLSLIFFFVFVIQSLNFDYKLLTNVEAAPLPHGDRNGYLEEWTAGQGLVEIATYLKSQTSGLKEDQKIVVGTEGYFGTLPQGLEIYTQGEAKIIVIGVGVNLTELPQQLLESKQSGNRTFLVINKSRLRFDPDDMNLKLISSFEKPLRKVGSVEYKNLGPRETLYLFEMQ